VRSDTPWAWHKAARNTIPIAPRQHTISRVLKWADANLIHTLMLAKNSEARTIHKACMPDFQ
jgi:hypothetical protein